MSTNQACFPVATMAVFKAARVRAGRRAAPERRGGVDRLTVMCSLLVMPFGMAAAPIWKPCGSASGIT